MHTFTSHNVKYRVLDTGVIEQVSPEQYKYDKDYVATYDTDAYRRGNETLQALRYGFVCAAHGQTPRSILDVGCANGAFVKFASQHTKVFGFDVVKSEDAWKVNEFIPADVYTFWDVLEHIHDTSFLFWLPCKTVCISLPYCHYNQLNDVDTKVDWQAPTYARVQSVRGSKGLTWFSDSYRHRKPNEHVRHFDRAALEAFMAQYGWHTIASGNHEDIIRKSEHGLPNILSMAFKRK